MEGRKIEKDQGGRLGGLAFGHGAAFLACNHGDDGLQKPREECRSSTPYNQQEDRNDDDELFLLTLGGAFSGSLLAL